MKITIIDSTGIDRIDSDDFESMTWNDVYGYVQKILDANGTEDRFNAPDASETWSGKQWLEFADSL